MADTREPTPRPLGHRATCPWLLSQGRVECTCGEYPEYAAPVPAPPAEPPTMSNVTTDDVLMFVNSLRAKATPWADGCADVLTSLHADRELLLDAYDAAPAAEPVAQQPPPTQDDDLVMRLTRRCACQRCSECDDERSEAAARIESDAKRIRELEAKMGERECALTNWHCESQGCAVPDGYTEGARLYADNFHKMKAALAASRERERALREALRKVRAHTSYAPTADPVPLLAGLLASIERIADAALATPDSAASPTGGEG